MNKAAIMNGRSLVLGLAVCLLAFNVSQAQIALSTYISEKDVAATLTPKCQTCSVPTIQPVLGDDNMVTPYFYTYCDDEPASFSLSVGIGKTSSTFFCFSDCSKHQFLALDSSKSTYAAQFYWDCKQGFLYKCKGNLVFDQNTGRCVPGGYLTYTNIEAEVELPCERTIFAFLPLIQQWSLGEVPLRVPPLANGETPLIGPQLAIGETPLIGPPFSLLESLIPQFPLPITTLGCESLVRNYLPSYCTICHKPTIQKILGGTECSSSQYVYTFCADNGQFSLDIVKDKYPHTFFAPNCRGRTLVALDPSRTTFASRFYWDCTYGLRDCGIDLAFDSYTNKCSSVEDPSKLKTGLEYCPKTCGVLPPFTSTYSAPFPYSSISAAPRTYSNPITAYAK